jgi:hypothetical protein
MIWPATLPPMEVSKLQHPTKSSLWLTTVWHLSKVLGNVKKKNQKKSLYNQPKPYFFQKIIVKSFLDRFLYFVCKLFPLFTLKCVSYEFLPLPSRKFNVAERLICICDSEIEVTLVVKYVHCYREQGFIFTWRLKCCSGWTEELLLCLLKTLNKGTNAF